MQRIIVIRHAPAQAAPLAKNQGVADAQRALSMRGTLQMRRVAAGLQPLFPHIDALLCSPLRRARQTAQLITEHYRPLSIHSCPALRPRQTPSEVFSALGDWSHVNMLALVGHEPNLGGFIQAALGSPRRVVQLKKAGVCLLEFPRALRPGTARLGALFTPQTLETLGKL